MTSNNGFENMIIDDNDISIDPSFIIIVVIVLIVIIVIA